MFTSISSCVPNSTVSTGYYADSDQLLDISSNIAVYVNNSLITTRPIQVNANSYVLASITTTATFLDYEFINYSIDGTSRYFAWVNKNDYSTANVKLTEVGKKWYNYVNFDQDISFYQRLEYETTLHKLKGWNNNKLNVNNLHVVLDPLSDSIHFYSSQQEMINRVQLPAAPIEYRKLPTSRPNSVYAFDLLVLCSDFKLYRVFFDSQYVNSTEFIPSVSPPISFSNLSYTSDLPNGLSFIDLAATRFLKKLFPVATALDVGNNGIWLGGSDTIYFTDFNFVLIYATTIPGEVIVAVAKLDTGAIVTTKTHAVYYVDNSGYLLLYQGDVVGIPCSINNGNDVVVPDCNNKRLLIFANNSGTFTTISTPDFVPAYAREFNGKLYVTGHDSYDVLYFYDLPNYKIYKFAEKVTLVSVIGDSLLATHYLKDYTILDLSNIEKVVPITMEPMIGPISHIGLKPNRLKLLGKSTISAHTCPGLTAWTNGIANEPINNNDYFSVSYKAFGSGEFLLPFILGDTAFDFNVTVKNSASLLDYFISSSNIIQIPNNPNIISSYDYFLSNVDFGNIDTGITANIMLGFTWNHYGNIFSNINIGTNGYITFDNDFYSDITTLGNVSIPIIQLDTRDLYQGLPIDNRDPNNILLGNLSTNQMPGIYVKAQSFKEFDGIRTSWVGTTNSALPMGVNVSQKIYSVNYNKVNVDKKDYDLIKINDYVSGSNITISTQVLAKKLYSKNISIWKSVIAGNYILANEPYANIEPLSYTFNSTLGNSHVLSTAYATIAGNLVVDNQANILYVDGVLDPLVTTDYNAKIYFVRSYNILNHNVVSDSITVANDSSGKEILVSQVDYAKIKPFQTLKEINRRVTNKKIVTKTLTASIDKDYVVEGNTVNIVITTVNVPDNTNVAYIISGVDITDFTNLPSLSGNITVVTNTGSLQLITNVDALTETETITVTLSGFSSNTLATSLNIVLDDSNNAVSNSLVSTISADEYVVVINNNATVSIGQTLSYDLSEIYFDSTISTVPLSGANVIFEYNRINLDSVSIDTNTLLTVGLIANLITLSTPVTTGPTEYLLFKTFEPAATVSYELGFYRGNGLQFLEVYFPYSQYANVASITTNHSIGIYGSSNVRVTSQRSGTFLFGSSSTNGQWQYLGRGYFTDTEQKFLARTPVVKNVNLTGDTVQYEFEIEQKIPSDSNVYASIDYGTIMINNISYRGYSEISKGDYFVVRIPNASARAIAPIISLGSFQFSLPTINYAYRSTFIENIVTYQNLNLRDLVTGQITIQVPGDYYIPDFYRATGNPNKLIYLISLIRSSISTPIGSGTHSLMFNDIIRVDQLLTSSRYLDNRDFVIVGPQSYVIQFVTQGPELFDNFILDPLQTPFVRQLDYGNVGQFFNSTTLYSSNVLVLSSSVNIPKANLSVESPGVTIAVNQSTSGNIIANVKTGDSIRLLHEVYTYFESNIIVYQQISDIDASLIDIPIGEWSVNNLALSNQGVYYSQNILQTKYQLTPDLTTSGTSNSGKFIQEQGVDRGTYAEIDGLEADAISVNTEFEYYIEEIASKVASYFEIDNLKAENIFSYSLFKDQITSEFLNTITYIQSKMPDADLTPIFTESTFSFPAAGISTFTTLFAKTPDGESLPPGTIFSFGIESNSIPPVSQFFFSIEEENLPNNMTYLYIPKYQSNLVPVFTYIITDKIASEVIEVASLFTFQLKGGDALAPFSYIISDMPDGQVIPVASEFDFGITGESIANFSVAEFGVEGVDLISPYSEFDFGITGESIATFSKLEFGMKGVDLISPFSEFDFGITGESIATFSKLEFGLKGVDLISPFSEFDFDYSGELFKKSTEFKFSVKGTDRPMSKTQFLFSYKTDDVSGYSLLTFENKGTEIIDPYTQFELDPIVIERIKTNSFIGFDSDGAEIVSYLNEFKFDFDSKTNNEFTYIQNAGFEVSTPHSSSQAKFKYDYATLDAFSRNAFKIDSTTTSVNSQVEFSADFTISDVNNELYGLLERYADSAASYLSHNFAGEQLQGRNLIQLNDFIENLAILNKDIGLIEFTFGTGSFETANYIKIDAGKDYITENPGSIFSFAIGFEFIENSNFTVDNYGGFDLYQMSSFEIDKFKYDFLFGSSLIDYNQGYDFNNVYSIVDFAVDMGQFSNPTEIIVDDILSSLEIKSSSTKFNFDNTFYHQQILAVNTEYQANLYNSNSFTTKIESEFYNNQWINLDGYYESSLDGLSSFEMELGFEFAQNQWIQLDSNYEPSIDGLSSFEMELGFEFAQNQWIQLDSNYEPSLNGLSSFEMELGFEFAQNQWINLDSNYQPSLNGLGSFEIELEFEFVKNQWINLDAYYEPSLNALSSFEIELGFEFHNNQWIQLDSNYEPSLNGLSSFEIELGFEFAQNQWINLDSNYQPSIDGLSSFEIELGFEFVKNQWIKLDSNYEPSLNGLSSFEIELGFEFHNNQWIQLDSNYEPSLNGLSSFEIELGFEFVQNQWINLDAYYEPSLNALSSFEIELGFEFAQNQWIQLDSNYEPSLNGLSSFEIELSSVFHKNQQITLDGTYQPDLAASGNFYSDIDFLFHFNQQITIDGIHENRLLGLSSFGGNLDFTYYQNQQITLDGIYEPSTDGVSSFEVNLDFIYYQNQQITLDGIYEPSTDGVSSFEVNLDFIYYQNQQITLDGIYEPSADGVSSFEVDLEFTFFRNKWLEFDSIYQPTMSGISSFEVDLDYNFFYHDPILRNLVFDIGLSFKNQTLVDFDYEIYRPELQLHKFEYVLDYINFLENQIEVEFFDRKELVLLSNYSDFVKPSEITKNLDFVFEKNATIDIDSEFLPVSSDRSAFTKKLDFVFENPNQIDHKLDIDFVGTATELAGIIGFAFVELSNITKDIESVYTNRTIFELGDFGNYELSKPLMFTDSIGFNLNYGQPVFLDLTSEFFKNSQIQPGGERDTDLIGVTRFFDTVDYIFNQDNVFLKQIDIKFNNDYTRLVEQIEYLFATSSLLTFDSVYESGIKNITSILGTNQHTFTEVETINFNLNFLQFVTVDNIKSTIDFIFNDNQGIVFNNIFEPNRLPPTEIAPEINFAFFEPHYIEKQIEFEFQKNTSLTFDIGFEFFKNNPLEFDSKFLPQYNISSLDYFDLMFDFQKNHYIESGDYGPVFFEPTALLREITFEQFDHTRILSDPSFGPLLSQIPFQFRDLDNVFFDHTMFDGLYIDFDFFKPTTLPRNIGYMFTEHGVVIPDEIVGPLFEKPNPVGHNLDMELYQVVERYRDINPMFVNTDIIISATGYLFEKPNFIEQDAGLRPEIVAQTTKFYDLDFMQNLINLLPIEMNNIFAYENQFYYDLTMNFADKGTKFNGDISLETVEIKPFTGDLIHLFYEHHVISRDIVSEFLPMYTELDMMLRMTFIDNFVINYNLEMEFVDNNYSIVGDLELEFFKQPLITNKVDYEFYQESEPLKPLVEMEFAQNTLYYNQNQYLLEQHDPVFYSLENNFYDIGLYFAPLQQVLTNTDYVFHDLTLEYVVPKYHMEQIDYIKVPDLHMTLRKNEYKLIRNELLHFENENYINPHNLVNLDLEQQLYRPELMYLDLTLFFKQFTDFKKFVEFKEIDDFAMMSEFFPNELLDNGTESSIVLLNTMDTLYTEIQFYMIGVYEPDYTKIDFNIDNTMIYNTDIYLDLTLEYIYETFFAYDLILELYIDNVVYTGATLPDKILQHDPIFHDLNILLFEQSDIQIDLTEILFFSELTFEEFYLGYNFVEQPTFRTYQHDLSLDLDHLTDFRTLVLDLDEGANSFEFITVNNQIPDNKSVILSDMPPPELIDQNTDHSNVMPFFASINFSIIDPYLQFRKTPDQTLIVRKQKFEVIGEEIWDNNDPAKSGAYSTRVQRYARIKNPSEIFRDKSFCIVIPENQTRYVEIPDSLVIKTIEFASFGTAIGSCGLYNIDINCHSLNSQQVVEQLLLHRTGNIAITANSKIFSPTTASTNRSLTIQFTAVQHGRYERYTDLTKAIGGDIYVFDDYVVHRFASGGTFTANQNIDVEFIAVGAGGGGGGDDLGPVGNQVGISGPNPDRGAGGGSGGLVLGKYSLMTGQSLQVFVGAGGGGGSSAGPGGAGGLVSGSSATGGIGGAAGLIGGSGGGGGGGGFSGLGVNITTGYNYNESFAANTAPYISNWNNKKATTMTNFAGTANGQGHGPLNNATFIFTSPTLPLHNQIKYSVNYHIIDRAFGEPHRIYVDGRLWAEFSKTPMNPPEFTLNRFATSNWVPATYSLSPGLTPSVDGYIEFSTGFYNHDRPKLVITHQCTFPPDTFDRSAYLTNVKVETPAGLVYIGVAGGGAGGGGAREGTANNVPAPGGGDQPNGAVIVVSGGAGGNYIGNGGGGGGGGAGYMGGVGQSSLIIGSMASGGGNFIHQYTTARTNLIGNEGNTVNAGNAISYDWSFNIAKGAGGESKQPGQNGIVLIRYVKKTVDTGFVLFDTEFKFGYGGYKTLLAAQEEAQKYVSAVPFQVPGTNYYNLRVLFNTNIYVGLAKPASYFYPNGVAVDPKPFFRLPGTELDYNHATPSDNTIKYVIAQRRRWPVMWLIKGG